jgi:hypothetical protein
MKTITDAGYMHQNNAVFSDRDPIMAVCQKLAENGKERMLQNVLLIPPRDISSLPQQHRGSVQWRKVPVELLGAPRVTVDPNTQETLKFMVFFFQAVCRSSNRR